MIAASFARPRRQVRLLVAERGSETVHGVTVLRALASLLTPGDALVVNDAATLPASFRARWRGADLEARLVEAPRGGFARAVLLGAGDWRQRTEERPAPVDLGVGETLQFKEDLSAEVVERLAPYFVRLRFSLPGARLWQALYRAAVPVQYAHHRAPLALYDVQTSYAAEPWAVEMPSAGYGLDWSTLSALRAAGVAVYAITHGAGLTATGHPPIDAMLPLSERYRVRAEVALALNETRRRGGRIVAVGTSVVRALESAARHGPSRVGYAKAIHKARGSVGRIRSGVHETSLVLDHRSQLAVVDGLVTGMHVPGESHYALLEAFASRGLLAALAIAADRHGLREHEHGDALVLLPPAISRAERPRETVAAR